MLARSSERYLQILDARVAGDDSAVAIDGHVPDELHGDELWSEAQKWVGYWISGPNR